MSQPKQIIIPEENIVLPNQLQVQQVSPVIVSRPATTSVPSTVSSIGIPKPLADQQPVSGIPSRKKKVAPTIQKGISSNSDNKENAENVF